MRSQTIQYVQKPVSSLVFGTATPIMSNAMRSVHGDAIDFDQRLMRAFSLLDTVYALGINTFDCAAHYGEEALGEWIASRNLQSDVAVLTKGAHHNPWRKRVTEFDILSDVHDSLAKLNVDGIDIYLLHRDDLTMPVGPIVEVLNRLYTEGKIHAFGASNWSTDRLAQANAYAREHNLIPFTVSSPYFALAKQVGDPWGGGCESIAGIENAPARAWYHEQDISVFAYSPLSRGLFSGRLKSNDIGRAAAVLSKETIKGYFSSDAVEQLKRCESLADEKGVTVAQIALAWMFSQQEVRAFAVIGSENSAHIKANIQACELTLTPEECAFLTLQDS